MARNARLPEEESPPLSPRAQHEARPLLWRTALAILPPLFALVLAVGSLLNPSPGQAQASISLGIDAVTDGNTATSLGRIQDCVEVQVGDLFTVDAYIRDVQDLIAWELAVGFDPAILEVIDHDNRLFLASVSFDASESVPDSSGQHFMAIATLGSGSSGSGVLARVTFKAKAPGRSSATIVFLDINGDGTVEFGPRLHPGAHPLGDSDGDGIFDGPVSQAEVAVGQSCNSSGSTPTPTPAPTATPTPTLAPTPIPTPSFTPTSTPTATAGPEDTTSPSGTGGNDDSDPPPASVLLTDSPPRDTGGNDGSSGSSGAPPPPASVLLTDSPPRGPSGEPLAPSSQAGEAADNAGGEDDRPDGSPDAETPEVPLRLVGEPPAGLTDGPPGGDSAPQLPDGDTTSFPVWLIGSIVGVLGVAGVVGMLIVRSWRQPWRG